MSRLVDSFICCLKCLLVYLLFGLLAHGLVGQREMFVGWLLGKLFCYLVGRLVDRLAAAYLLTDW